MRLPPAGAEQIQVRNDTGHRLEHVRAIVYEMGYADLSAMQGFLRTLETEAHIATVDTGTLKEAMVVEPLCARLSQASPSIGLTCPSGWRISYLRSLSADDSA